MKSNIIFLWSLLLLPGILLAQDVEYSRKIISILSSADYSGRGYTNEGLAKSSKLIKSEMEKMGLLPIEGKYSQNFDYPVRVVDSCHLVISGKSLKEGEEFIVFPTCPDIKGQYKVLTLAPKNKNDALAMLEKGKKFKGKVLLIDTRNISKDGEARREIKNASVYKSFQPAGIIIIDSTDYMYNISKYMPEFSFFQIFLHRSAFPTHKVKKVEVSIDTRKEDHFPATNVFGILQGREFPDSFLVLTAHYDHLGKMGKAFFPGANDNASGVAMMLTIAKSIKDKRFRPRYSIAFFALAGEEVGLYGSEYCAKNPPIELSKVKALINLDMVGTGSDGITVVNGDKYPWLYKLMSEVNKENQLVKEVKKRGESCNSDHCPFDKKGVPSVFIYSLGKEHLEYHNVFDSNEKLPMTKFSEIARLIELTLYSF